MFKYIDAGKIFSLRNNAGIRGNDKTVMIPFYKTEPKRHSFAYRSIHTWNGLSNEIVNAPNVNSFKTKIDSFLSA